MGYDERIHENKWRHYEHKLDIILAMMDPMVVSVMDIGAGPEMYIGARLPEYVDYIPVDYIKRSDATFIYDLNNYEFPDFKVETMIASGILEYLEDLDWIINKFCENCWEAIVTYPLLDQFESDPERIKHWGYVNQHQKEEIIEMFTSRGMELCGEKFDDYTWSHVLLFRQPVDLYTYRENVL